MAWSDPPTGRQVHAIAVLAQRLGIHDPIEEKIKDRGEARDTLHRLLEEMRKRERRRRQDTGISQEIITPSGGNK